ncbi:MAG: 4-hydroxythreonine-4-phosphate dehydrogenase PdxA [Mizugakiibacter sp.]|uniref:4-hydroxythreonine-4-phosphate dehydrogenase PdxA n=1 Tax=Mizugakiibacter sp. TaxID=1972610 RepID=UPI0031CA8AF9|nr:4-hydroxythreonine-4-phosphate dehydrogenase PdxA [Xanthomonadaceae bacterium]
MPALPRLAVTPGEPAGVGPELVARLAATPIAADLVVIADPDLMARAARAAGVALRIEPYDPERRVALRAPGTLRVLATPLRAPEQPGKPDPRNAFYVLNTLARAADGCLAGEFDALVTGPVQKSSIADTGEPFSGHTEFFAERAGADVVMMLASDTLRVALATTHLPLAEVPAAITRERIERTLRIVARELTAKFGIARPRIAVLGLNPHAGEGGHLGREEIDTIVPAMDTLRAEGLDLLGPLPADTAFVPAMRARYDAVLAMYHDQALPVLKSEAFDRTVNLTLGLPFVRTSVDHGTALELAGTGRADPASLVAAAGMALDLAGRKAGRGTRDE